MPVTGVSKACPVRTQINPTNRSKCGLYGSGYIPPMMSNQMEKNMDDEMKAGLI